MVYFIFRQNLQIAIWGFKSLMITLEANVLIQHWNRSHSLVGGACLVLLSAYLFF